MYRINKHRRPTGFTLTELLVVITIMAILMALLVAVVYYAFAGAKENAMWMETQSIQKGFELYKAKHGSYPPDGTNQEDVSNHIRSIHPRASAAGIPSGLDQAEMLVFWLKGYTSDPRNPISKDFEECTAYCELNPSQLVDTDGDGYPTYFPKGSDAPMVYFHHDTYGQGTCTTKNRQNKEVEGEARPYKNGDNQWFNANKFQIVTAGSDNAFSGEFGEEGDNVCNFCDGGTLFDTLDK